MKNHWDAWHNPILGYFDMLSYYRRDAGSIEVLRKNPSHRYIAIASVQIIIDPSRPNEITVNRVYPGGQSSQIHLIGQRVLIALRALYSRTGGIWKASKDGRKVIFSMSGRIVRCPGGRDLYHTPERGV